MKNLILILINFYLLVIIISNSALSQTGDNFFKIYSSKMEFFDSLAQIENKDVWELDGYLEFQRWVDFFMPRNGNNGSIGEYVNALQNYHDDGDNINDGDNFTEWDYIGHHGLIQNHNGNYDNSVGQGWINSLWVNPDSINHILAGSHNGGIWKTTDGGDNWVNITESYENLKGVKSIYVLPDNINKIFVVTTTLDQYSHGLFYSSDGGTTWTQNKVYVSNVGNYYPTAGKEKLPNKWIVNPDNDQIMWLITYTQVLMSLNGGNSWDIIINRTAEYTSDTASYTIWLHGIGFRDLEFDPSNNSIVYASGYEVFKIYNQGNDYDNITATLLNGYGYPTDGAKRIFMGTHKNYPNKIWFSIYTKLNSLNQTAGILVYLNTQSDSVVHLATDNKIKDDWKMQCEVSPIDTGHIVLGGVRTVFYNKTANPKIYYISENSVGFNDPNWVHSDIRDVCYLVDNNNEVIFTANDGSVSRGHYLGPTGDLWNWDFIGNDGLNGITNGESHGFDISDNVDDIIYTGYQDMNGAIYDNGVWYHVLTGDGSIGLIDKTDPNYIYTACFGAPEGGSILQKSTNKGETFNFIKNLLHKTPALALNPENPNILFVGDLKKLYKYSNIQNDNTYSTILSIPDDPVPPEGYSISGSLSIRQIAIAESNPNVIFCSTERFFPGWENNYLIAKALYKSIDGGNTWIDLSQIPAQGLNIGLSRGFITRIVINPYNADEIWIGFSGTDLGSNPSDVILHSMDGGDTWQPMDPQPNKVFPCNDLQYDKKTGMFYYANDIGVYMLNGATNEWQIIDNNLPPAIIKFIRFNHTLNKIRIATYGRGIWETEIPCVNNSVPLIVNVSDTWSTTKHLYSSVTIEPTCTLTITNKVFLPEDAKIIVKPGAKLKIDGGTLTNACEGLWRGIEVRGHINQPQHPSYQGVVEIKNGGTIENALFGIRTIHAEDDENAEGELLDPTSSGGIVFANNARFVNNKTAVRFYSYPSNSLSSFIDCRFETDADLINGVIPDYFIWIDHISGIDIKNCSFNNTTGIDYLHSGIYARDATFRIEGNCISQVQPCTEWQYGWFRKLNYAVYVVNTSTIYYPDIRHTDFSLCKRGIYISTTDGARVTSCRFYMPSAAPITQGDYGLYLNNSFGYHIEDNRFTGPSPSLLGGIGLYINFSGEHWNQVYNNSFSNLNYGTMAYGLNRKPDGVGLCIKCNDYDYNKYDIVVNGKQNIGHGIAYNQGYMYPYDTMPAGNTFTQNFSPLVYNYMNSKGMEWVIYVYHGMNPTQERVNPEPYYSPLTMSKQANANATYSKTFACPSKLDAGGGSHERDGIEAAEAEINQKEAQLVALVDGGNTFDMNLNVITSTPPEASEVYNNLMGESPFLSDTVMKSAIYKENVLPSAMVRDVLVANPQSAKNYEILKAIDERFDPMPEWMKEQVLQGINITGAKEALESELANWQSKRAEHFNNLYQYLRKDTINPLASTDSLQLLLAQDNQIESKYRLAFMKIEQGIWNEGLAVLNSIPASFGLSALQQAVHQDYLSLFTVLMQLNGNLPVEGSAEALQLEQLAADDENFPGACARNLLIAAGLIEYEEPIVLPEEGLKSSEAIGNRTDKNTGKPEVLKVFPNPAGDYFIAEYNAEGYTGDVFLLVTDVTGKTVYTRQFSNNRDQVVINTEDWYSGIYQVSLLVNGKIIKCENVIIK